MAIHLIEQNSQPAELWFVGVHADETDRAILLAAFPEGELIKHDELSYFWVPSFVGLQEAELHEAARRLYRSVVEACWLKDGLQVKLSPYARDLLRTDSGMLFTRDWSPITAALYAKLEDNTVQSTCVTVGADIAAINSEFASVPPIESRLAAQVDWMRSAHPRFGKAMDLLCNGVPSDLELRQAKEHIIEGLREAGLIANSDDITREFSNLASIGKDEIASMKDTMDHRWIHVNKTPRLQELSRSKIYHILRQILKGWLEKAQTGNDMVA